MRIIGPPVKRHPTTCTNFFFFPKTNLSRNLETINKVLTKRKNYHWGESGRTYHFDKNHSFVLFCFISSDFKMGKTAVISQSHLYLKSPSFVLLINAEDFWRE